MSPEERVRVYWTINTKRVLLCAVENICRAVIHTHVVRGDRKVWIL